LENLTKDAALIATFYGKKAKLGPLLEKIKATFGDLKRYEEGRELFYFDHKGQEIVLERFTVAGNPAHDTEFVQLSLNEPGPASEAWGKLLQRLESCDLKALLATFSDQDYFWGYSLVYQAVSDQLAPAEALPLLGPVMRGSYTPEIRLQPLATTKVLEGGGEVWLMDVPLTGKGLEAATVYGAIVTPEQNDALNKLLCGKGAPLLIPDLIAHKGYYHIRQYQRKEWRTGYKEAVKKLRTSAGEAIYQQVLGSEAKNLEQLKQTFAVLPNLLNHLDPLLTILSMQQYNYDMWPINADLKPILDYHRRHLGNGLAELKVLREMGENALKVTNTALKFVQTEQDQMREQREHNLERLLTFCGLAIGLSQIFTLGVVCDFLVFLAAITHSNLPLTCSNPPFWVVFPQIVLILALTIGFFYLIKLGKKWYEGMQRK